MGSQCHVIILDGDAQALERAEAAVRRLESLWSRFRADSEISVLNAAAGGPRRVSGDTLILLCRALRAHRLTAGWFDPFLGRDLAALGYDRDFEQILGIAAQAPGTRSYTLRGTGDRVSTAAVSDYSTFAIDLDSRTARLPVGVDFDPGGLGKGLGADLVSRTIVDEGARGALVNLGGDLRCRGDHPDGGWEVTIENPLDPAGTLDQFIRLTDGAVATSTPLKRNWANADGSRAHHLLNPSTHAPMAVEIAAATVIAPTGWEAEMLVKTLLLAGPAVGVPLLRKHRAAGVVVTLDGSVVQV
ncbi:MAG: FAD:protein FMN transferase [Candidatus Nanopelagicales bacterium]|nr:FAD:protein FMN transferase [Candidatus Nanopelagicales bacterium]